MASHSPERSPPRERGRRSTGRLHPDVSAALVARLELDLALGQGKERVVAADADIGAGVEFGAALAHEDVARDDDLAAELLDAEPPAGGVAAVAGAAACFLVGHS